MDRTTNAPVPTPGRPLPLIERVRALLYVEQSGVPINKWGNSEEDAQANLYAAILDVDKNVVSALLGKIVSRGHAERRTEVAA